jgi:hypothetical protein
MHDKRVANALRMPAGVMQTRCRYYAVSTHAPRTCRARAAHALSMHHACAMRARRHSIIHGHSMTDVLATIRDRQRDISLRYQPLDMVNASARAQTCVRRSQRMQLRALRMQPECMLAASKLHACSMHVTCKLHVLPRHRASITRATPPELRAAISDVQNFVTVGGQSQPLLCRHR